MLWQVNKFPSLQQMQWQHAACYENPHLVWTMSVHWYLYSYWGKMILIFLELDLHTTEKDYLLISFSEPLSPDWLRLANMPICFIRKVPKMVSSSNWRRLGGLSNKHLFLKVWRLDVQGQVAADSEPPFWIWDSLLAMSYHGGKG